MFNRLILISIIFLFSFEGSYSETDISKKQNDIKISLGYRQSLVMFNNGNQLNVCVEYFISDNTSLDYSLAYNFSSDKTFLHAPLGLVGGFVLLAESLGNNFNAEDYLSSLLFVIPEGINFYIPMNEKMNIVPYIHPLGYDYVIDDYSITSSVGAKFEIEPIENISLNPFAGIKIFYKHKSAKFGFDIGLLFGIKF